MWRDHPDTQEEQMLRGEAVYGHKLAAIYEDNELLRDAIDLARAYNKDFDAKVRIAQAQLANPDTAQPEIVQAALKLRRLYQCAARIQAVKDATEYLSRPAWLQEQAE